MGSPVRRTEERQFHSRKLLGADFKQAFEKLQLPKDQLDSKYLEMYQNHIEEYLPSLQEIVKVRHEVEKKEGAGAGRAGSESGRGRVTGCSAICPAALGGHSARGGA